MNMQTNNATAAGLAEVELGQGRADSRKKKIINSSDDWDLNQLVPFQHLFAWEKYLDACKNHWMPNEIDMTKDCN